MRKSIIVLFTFIAFVSNSIGQVSRKENPSQATESNAGQKAKKKQMMKDLDLTKEQRGQMKEFHKSIKEKKETINNDPSLTEVQKKEKMKDLHKEQKEKMNTILTPEQKEKLKKERKNAKVGAGVSK
jgi:Spy/CpxP family protein refolding chaperone